MSINFPYIVSLDCSKAFDTCKWSLLFHELSLHLPPVIVRVLIYSYRNQVAWIVWGDQVSDTFTISNGTGQGKVASPIFWSSYILPLLSSLRDTGVGFHLEDVYVGSILFADDVILACPSRMASQILLNVFEEWSNKFGVTFSTDPVPAKSKTKAMRVTGGLDTAEDLAPLILNGQKLPYVHKIVHLGHTFTSDEKMDTDAHIKRVRYIHKWNEVRENYSQLHPIEILAVSSIHCMAFYESNLWNYQSHEVEKIF